MKEAPDMKTEPKKPKSGDKNTASEQQGPADPQASDKELAEQELCRVAGGKTPRLPDASK
jgi:hypothetical protein